MDWMLGSFKILHLDKMLPSLMTAFLSGQVDTHCTDEKMNYFPVHLFQNETVYELFQTYLS